MAGTEVGPLKLTLTAHTAKFNTSVKAATTNLKNFMDTAKMVSKQASKMKLAPSDFGTNLNKQLASAIMSIKASMKSMNQFVRYGPKVQGMTAATGRGLNNVMNNFEGLGTSVQKSTRRVTDATKTMRHISIKELLSFRNFLGKIVHYITFSVGVQMVMKIRQGFSDLIDTFSEFERSATNAATISGYLGAAFEKVREHIKRVSRELGRSTVFSALDVAKAFYSLASAGLDVSKITEKELEPILNYAAATQTELDEATQAVLVTLKQFQMEMSETAHVTDVFTTAITSSFLTMETLKEGMKYAGPIAGVLGIELEELTAALATLKDRGLEGGQAGQRLNMVMTKLLKPTDKAKTTLEAMGYSMEDISPLGNSLTEVLARLEAGGFGAGEAAEMFRARTAGAAAVLVENAENIAIMAERYRMAEGITKAVAEAQEDTLWGALTKTNNRMVEMMTNVGENLAPVIIHFTEILQKSLAPILEALGGFFKFVTENAAAFKTILRLLTALLIVYITKIKIIPALEKLWIGTSKALWIIKSKLLAMTFAHIKGLILYQASMIRTIYQTQGLIAALKALKIALITNPLTWFAVAIGAVVGALVLFRGETEKISDEQKILNSRLTKFQSTLLNTGVTAKSSATQIGMVFSELVADATKGDEAAKRVIKSIADMAGKTVKEIMTVHSYGHIQDESVIKAFKKAITEESSYVNILAKSITNLRDEFDTYELSLYVITRDTAKFEIAQRALKDENKSYTDILNDLRNENGEYASSLDETADNYAKEMEFVGQRTRIYNELARHWIPDLIDVEGKAVDRREVLVKATNALNESEQAYMKATGALLQGIRGLTTGLDYYIGKVETAAEANLAYSRKKEDLIDLEREETRATSDLTEALMEYGAGTNEAIDAEERLMDAIEARVEAEVELIDLDLQASQGADIIEKAMNGLTITYQDAKNETQELSDAEKEILGYAGMMITYRDQLIQATAKEALWTARLNTLKEIGADADKYLGEELLKLYEAEDKLFEIEYKLYKLRHDEDDQLDDMFQSLAEQGLINKDMIDQYADMERAEGEVLKMNHAFAEAMGDLTEDEQDLVKQFMRGEKSEQDLLSAGISNVGVFVDMKNAQDELAKATKKLDSNMSPLVGDMVDMNIVSSETAKKYYDLIDNAYELAAGEKKLDKQGDKISDSFDNVLGIVGQLAMSMIDGEEGSANMMDIWNDLTDALGIGSTSFEEIIALTGSTASTMSELTDEEFILAAALKTTAQDLRMYEAGIEGKTIAEKLGLVSTNNLSNAYSILRQAASDAVSPMYTYAEALNNQTIQSGLANQALIDLKSSASNLADYLEENVDDFTIGDQLITDIDKAILKIDELILKLDELIRKQNKADVGGSRGHGGGDVKPKPPKDTTPDWLKWLSPLHSDPWRPSAKGIMPKLQNGIRRIDKATPAIIGEAGAEAVVPLEGANRRYGESILQSIIPRYFPDMARAQSGGIFGTNYSRSVTHTTGPTTVEEYNIMGPITVQGVSDVSSFMDQLKRSARASKRY